MNLDSFFISTFYSSRWLSQPKPSFTARLGRYCDWNLSLCIAIAYDVAQNYITDFVFLLEVVATNQLVEDSVNEKGIPWSELPASQTL